jgi:hypothetical protein
MEEDVNSEGLSNRQARLAAARRALGVMTRHRALLSLPEMLDEQAVLHEWEAMAHNVTSARLGIGQNEATVLLEVLSACETKVASVLRDHHNSKSVGTDEKQCSGAASSSPPVDSDSSGGSSMAGLSNESEPRGGRLSRWKRILNSTGNAS